MGERKMRENPQFFGVPAKSIETICGTLVVSVGNFIAYDPITGERYIGDIFSEPREMLKRRLRRFSFHSTSVKPGMARYALLTLTSIKPGDIIVTKIGDNKLKFYMAGKYRFYIAWHPADTYVKEHTYHDNRGRIWVDTHEKYCISVIELGETEVDKEFYKKIAVPRAITLFKNPEITSKLQSLVKKLENNT